MWQREPYQQMVVEPGAHEVMKINKQAWQDMNRTLKCTKSNEIVEKGSHFQAYSMDVTSIEEVRKAYLLLKKKHFNATHVICAYRLNNFNERSHQERADDGENGGGRCLLNLLIKENCVNTAIFVVRQFGGQLLGTARFQKIEQADRQTCAVVETLPVQIVKCNSWT